MNIEEIQRRLIEGIRDSYTLNLAISILEDLDIANKKLDKIEKYIKENACYDELKKECQCSFSSMALDNVLKMIGGE